MADSSWMARPTGNGHILGTGYSSLDEGRLNPMELNQSAAMAVDSKPDECLEVIRCSSRAYGAHQ